MPFNRRSNISILKNYNAGILINARYSYSGSRISDQQIEQLRYHSLAPGPHTSKPHSEHKIYPYLLHDIEITRPCQVFSTDITYVRLKHGFVYLIAIIDWYSRYVLDWQLSINMGADFCVETLERVLAHSRCGIFNTDQGSQFTSKDFTDVLKAYQVDISREKLKIAFVHSLQYL